MEDYPSLVKTWSSLVKIVVIAPYILLVITSVWTIIHCIMTTTLINKASPIVGCLWIVPSEKINLYGNLSVVGELSNVTCKNYLLGTTLYIPIVTALILPLILFIVTDIILRMDRTLNNTNDLVREAYSVIKMIDKDYHNKNYVKKVYKAIIIKLYKLLALFAGFILLFTMAMTIVGTYSHYYTVIYKTILYGNHNEYADRLLSFSNYIMTLVNNNTAYWVQLSTTFLVFYVFIVLVMELYIMRSVKKKDKQ